MKEVREIAPAKINWTLEVLGRRADGYHQIRTVMQTIDLCDEVLVEPGDEIRLEGGAAGEDDLALGAARLLALEAGCEAGATVCVRKRIPVRAGLGGGSSDAAASLRALDRLWGLGYGRERLAGLAAKLGSDVPFFVYGGTALCEGRGERVTPLPDVVETWLVLASPPYEVGEKTRRMYGALTREDFVEGARTEALVEAMRSAVRLEEPMLFNAFERAAYEVFTGLAGYRDALLSAGARRVHVAGSGPSLFALFHEELDARQAAGRLRLPGVAQVFVAKTCPHHAQPSDPSTP